MTMVVRLCALCAACTLCEIVLPEGSAQDGLRMIGGLLMLQLVLSMLAQLYAQLSSERDLMRILEIMMK